MIQEHSIAECSQRPEIVAAKNDLKETLSSFLTLKVGGTEKEDALKAAHLLFDSYCEQIEVAEVMVEEPKSWVNDGLYETEEEVIAEGEDLAKFYQDLMVVARQLWSISCIGMDYAI